jgi:hypothetical protein
MGLFDVFTGQPQRDAAGVSLATLQAIYPQLIAGNAGAADRAGGFITSGTDRARGDLGTGYGVSSDALRTGTGNALNFLDTGLTGATGMLDRGRGDLGSARESYVPLTALAGKFGAGADLLADALGVNGAGGNARATDAFHTAPGFDFTLSTGLDAINRGRNARGMVNSGNTDVDALKFGTGLANQTYQQWIANLSPYNALTASTTGAAAAGNADIGKSLAGLDVTGAGLVNGANSAKAGVANDSGIRLSDLARSYYGSLGGLDSGEGGALASNTLQANQNNSNATFNLLPQWTGAFRQSADAQTAGNANLWNLGIQGARLLAGSGAFPGMPGASSGGASTGFTGNSTNPFPGLSGATTSFQGGIPYPMFGPG